MIIPIHVLEAFDISSDFGQDESKSYIHPHSARTIADNI
jgi:hypothetical protein